MLSSHVLVDALECRVLMSAGPINICPPLYSYLGGGNSQVMVTVGDGEVVATLPSGQEVAHTVSGDALLRAAWGKMPG